MNNSRFLKRRTVLHLVNPVGNGKNADAGNSPVPVPECSRVHSLATFGPREEHRWFFDFHPRASQKNRARTCRPFKKPRNRFPAYRVGTTTLFVVPARKGNWLAESIPWNRFLDSINVFKYGLGLHLSFSAKSSFYLPAIEEGSLHLISMPMRSYAAVYRHNSSRFFIAVSF